MPKVTLQKIEKSFQARPLLCGLNLETRPNEYLVLLGQSGSGKTTTLRIIAGLEKPDQGGIYFDDVDVKQVAARHRDVSLMFQHDGLYPHLTVEENLRFPLRGKLNRAGQLSRIEQIAGVLDIEPFLRRIPERLSGGELRRVSLAKSVIRQASVRLLDEPLSALDASLRHQFQHDLVRIHRQFPALTIHVTHDGNEAMRMGDRIAVLDRGVIAQIDTPENIYWSPANVSVAKAVGSPPINLFRAKQIGDRVRFDLAGIEPLHLPGVKTENELDIIVGIRPESFQIDREAPRTTARQLRLTGECCWTSVFQGMRQMQLRCGSQTVEVLLDRSETVSVGATMQLKASGGNVYRFEADGGNLLDNPSE
ncbi:Trehalose import ATP-binding protein SugC [Planctomycetes bacterium CA13]|uniref:Trehalose import ATP-binding protein SugC n=1 Tax=Novipirellula herctigrandis TaxID=2527986 RepID=A0A5C5YVD2_9BACT|nr:Trehalose import ATP-binding protein SugC [Planctomycetes bacterium CA13]